MADGIPANASVQAPYFFLSYGRTPSVEGDRQPPDRNLVRFHQDLSRHIMQLTDLRAGISPGYLDRLTEIGSAWETELKRELAKCQVLVPVYSPRFVASRWCGKEWQAFERRQQLQRDKQAFTRNAVVPVLWVPLPDDQLPPVLRGVQYVHDGVGQAYQQEGLYALMAAERWGVYKRTTLAIARTIVSVARSSRLDPCTPSVFDDLGNAFEEEP